MPAKENNKPANKKHFSKAQVVEIKLQIKRKEIGTIKHARGPATNRPPCHVQDRYTNTSCSLKPKHFQPITAPIPETRCLLSVICFSRTQIINAKNSDPCLPITTYPHASQLGRIAPTEWNPINTLQKKFVPRAPAHSEGAQHGSSFSLRDRDEVHISICLL